jgi:hypothetical protein
VIAEPAKTALRKTRRAQRPPRKVCRRCIVDHHVLGRKHDPQFIDKPCQYHHALDHDQMLDVGVDLQFQRDPVRRQVEILKIEAFYYRQQAGYYRDWADAKERQAEALLKYLERETTK